MNEIFFTITGTRYYHGTEFMKEGMIVKLEKDPDNEHDKEAINVLMPGLGQVGNVANSPNTVIGESMSAGRMYDKIGETAEGRILYILPSGVLCVLNEGINEENSILDEN